MTINNEIGSRAEPWYRQQNKRSILKQRADFYHVKPTIYLIKLPAMPYCSNLAKNFENP